jgi:hypothetical protein
MAVIKKMKNKYWAGYGENRIFVHCGRNEN